MGYWIKLYTEILDDYKYSQLPVQSQVLMYELFLLAGKMNEGGRLPETKEEIAFVLRRPEEFINEFIAPLVKSGIVLNSNGYTVSKFAERQAPVTNSERVRTHRRNVSVTQMKRNCNDVVTNRYVDTDTDTDTEKIQKEGEGEKKRTSAAFNSLSENGKTYYLISQNYPSHKQNSLIEYNLNLLRNTKYFTENPDRLTDYLSSVFDTWLNTQNKTGAYYKPSNPGWLDWAVELDRLREWASEVAA